MSVSIKTELKLDGCHTFINRTVSWNDIPTVSQ